MLLIFHFGVIKIEREKKAELSNCGRKCSKNIFFSLYIFLKEHARLINSLQLDVGIQMITLQHTFLQLELSS